MRSKLLALVLTLGLAGTVSGQSLPLYQPSGLTYEGRITLPTYDSLGNLIAYGGGAVGVSEDGKELYIACNSKAGGNNQDLRGHIWRGTIPKIGEMSQEIAPCQGLSKTDLEQIAGRTGLDSPLIGGVTKVGPRWILNGYINYDAGPDAFDGRKTWWVGNDLQNLSGPVEGSVRNGLVMNHTFRIPQNLQSTLGGDIGVTANYTSIISRASYGATFSTFKSSEVGLPGFKINFLMGCPSYDPQDPNKAELTQCTSNYLEGSPADYNRYNGAEKMGGVFIVPQTRTLAISFREGKTPMCYGFATTNQALHGTYHSPGANWCYSLSGDPNNKGMHSYPYFHALALYDTDDHVKVKQGLMKPWDVKPYLVITMPNSTDDFDIGYKGNGVFVSQTGRLYLTKELWPNGQGGIFVDVFAGFPTDSGIVNPPTPIDCVKGIDRMIGEVTDNQCVDNVKTYVQTWTRDGDVKEQNGGTACVPTIPYQLTRTEPCTEPPILVDVACRVTGQGTKYADGDQRPVVRCDNNLTGPRIPNGTTFILKVPKP